MVWNKKEDTSISKKKQPETTFWTTFGQLFLDFFVAAFGDGKNDCGLSK